MAIRDRVIEMKKMPGRSISPNPRNWREHPKAQREALTGILQEVGVAGTLLCYYSERNDGKLTLIDGHLRAEDYQNVEWPVVILDVDDEEADALLASHDPLAALARRDQEKLDDLLNDVRAWNKSPELDKLFDSMHSEEADEADEPESAPPPQYLILVTCADEGQQADLLEQLTGMGLEVKALSS